MPYVEGFGTWPFGEEWLWEAIATSYVPLLDVLPRAPITLSLTPVLCDQLEAPGVTERCQRFLEDVRPESHRLDIEAFRKEGQHGFASELERSASEYAGVAERLGQLRGGLAALFQAQATWTSASTSSGVSPGRVRRSMVSTQRSGYVDMPLPPAIIEACREARPSSG